MMGTNVRRFAPLSTVSLEDLVPPAISIGFFNKSPGAPQLIGASASSLTHGIDFTYRSGVIVVPLLVAPFGPTQARMQEVVMSVDANRALIQRLLDEVLTQHNLAALDEIVHPNFVELDPVPGQGPGREGLKQWFAMYFAAFPDVRWTLEEQVAEADKVMSRSTWQGTHQGPFLGIPPTGKSIRVAAWTIDRIVDGQLVESRILMDALGMLQQLGAIPTPE